MNLTRILLAGALGASLTAVLPAQDSSKLSVPGLTPPPTAQPAAPQFSENDILETWGWALGKRLGFNELGFTPEQVAAITKGMAVAAEGKDSPCELEKIGPELDKYLQGKQAAYKAQQDALNGKLRDVNSKAEDDFFAKLKTNPAVTALPDGLCYEIVKPGTGPYPTADDTVKVHYTGTLLNGTVFDSSVQRGQPVEFPLKGVIPGWTEGLQKINVGGKIKLYIPYKLAYGAEGRPPTIPPASTLIFDVELLEITPAAAPAAPAATAPAGK